MPGFSSVVGLTNADKNVANGIAGLDANKLLSPTVVYPIYETYVNHAGTTDNFAQSGVTGNGTPTTSVAAHSMFLSTGLTNVGSAKYESKKTWALNATKPIVLNFMLQNIIDGVSGTRSSWVGLKVDFLDSESQGVTFWGLSDGTWCAYSKDGAGSTDTVIDTLVNGDLLTIVVTSVKALFYVNGTLVATHTTNIPAGALKIGGSVIVTVAAATTARQIGIDLIDITVYK